MAMSQDQLKQIALQELAAEELAAEEAQSVPVQEPQAEQVEPTTMEALSTGFVEGVPFLKDGVAAYDAISEAVTSDQPFNLDKTIDQYRSNLDDMNQTINTVEELAPLTTMAGDIVGGVATIPAGAGLKAAAAVGALQGLSRSEDREVSDLVSGAALGVVGQKAGELVGAGIKSAGGKVMAGANEALKKVIGADKIRGTTKINKHLKISKQSSDEFLDSVRKMGVVNAGDDAAKILDNVSKVKQEVGQGISQFYKQVDDEFKPQIELDTVKTRLSDKMDDLFLSSDDPGMQSIGADLQSYIAEIGHKTKNIKKGPTGAINPDGSQVIGIIEGEIIPDAEWSVSRLHGLQKDIRGRIASIYKRNGADITESKENQRKIAAEIGNIIDETLEGVSTPEAPIFNQVKDLRRKFGNLSTVEELVEEKVNKTTSGPIIGLKSTLLALTGASIGGPGGALAGFAIDRIIHDPKTPTYIAKGLPSVSQILQADPTSRVATRLITASTMSSKKFRTTLEGTIAEVNLKTSKIPRSVADARNNFADIEKFLSLHQPSTAKKFKDIVENGNDEEMAAFLDGMSKIRGADKYFEEGVGMNGKVYAKEDVQMLENQLKNTNMPSVQKQRMLKELRASGTIPKMEEVVPREPRKYVPKSKRNPSY